MLSTQPLDDRQFLHTLEAVQQLLRAGAQAALLGVELPMAFARVQSAIEGIRATPFLDRFPHARAYVACTNTEDVLACCIDQVPIVNHGDLHAGNLIWSGERLAGIIDFAAAGEGPPALEVAALATGTCFVGRSLRVERVVALVRVLQRWLRGVDAEAFVDLLIATALSFFAEVNQGLVMPEQIEWRDLERAEALLIGRNDLALCLRAVLGLRR